MNYFIVKYFFLLLKMSKVSVNNKKQFIFESDEDDLIESSDSYQEFPEDYSNTDSSESEESEECNQISELIKMNEVIIFPKNKKNNNITSSPIPSKAPIPSKIPMPSKVSQVPRGSHAPIPNIKGLNISTTDKAPVIVKKYNSNEIDLMTKNMPGINIGKEYKKAVGFNISDLLEKEAAESIKDFQIRTEITTKIANIKDPKISDLSSVILGLMITKKLRYGVKYDENIELLIKFLMSLMSLMK